MPPGPDRKPFTLSGVKRAWERLPLGWKIGSAVAAAWLIIVPIGVTPFLLSGNRLPMSVRILEAISKFIALGVIIGAVHEARRMDPAGLSLPGIVVVLTLAVVIWGFLGPVFR